MLDRNISKTVVRRTATRVGAALLGLLSASTVLGVEPVTANDANARYARERAECLQGATGQDRETCLKEAGAARDAARRQQLAEGDENYRRNEKERCDALAGDEAKDCLARMRGKGSKSGSVKGGGIYRETVTREVTPASGPASAASAASAP